MLGGRGIHLSFSPSARIHIFPRKGIGGNEVFFEGADGCNQNAPIFMVPENGCEGKPRFPKGQIVRGTRRSCHDLLETGFRGATKSFKEEFRGEEYRH